ncbi:hypothetical protein RBB50_000264 [Rhinocladiella similis]
MPTTTDKETGLEIVPLWIDGAPAKSAKEAKFPVYSSARQKNVFLAQSADIESAVKAAESVEKAFESWKKTPAAARRKIVLRYVELVQERAAELIQVQIEETSCSEAWAKFNIDYTVGMINEVAARITTACTGEVPPMANDGTFGIVIREPIGPVLLIAPWNAAVVLATRGLAAILSAGCTAVFKASELSPRTHHLLLELWIEAGLPKNAISVVQTQRSDAPAVTEALIAHPAIRKIEFVGSAPVGRIIGSLAGKYLKPILMELGGKCAAIVLEDANLEDAATKSVIGAFNHHGQICFSTERIVVLRSVADSFIDLVKKKTLQWPQTHGVNARIVRTSYEMLTDAQSKGAEFILGKPEYLSETSLTPAILTGVTKEMKIWDEESFGPSTTVVVVDDHQQAIRVVNESNYGLDTILFTKDMKRAIEIAQELQVGRIRVNSVAHEATFPTNPVKGSGYGANNGRHGIEEFLLKKVITMDFR